MRKYFYALAPHATGDPYVNFTTESEGEQSMASLENNDRLVHPKNVWDPTNRFRMNNDVKPTG